MNHTKSPFDLFVNDLMKRYLSYIKRTAYIPPALKLGVKTYQELMSLTYELADHGLTRYYNPYDETFMQFKIKILKGRKRYIGFE